MEAVVQSRMTVLSAIRLRGAAYTLSEVAALTGLGVAALEPVIATMVQDKLLLSLEGGWRLTPSGTVARQLVQQTRDRIRRRKKNHDHV